MSTPVNDLARLSRAFALRSGAERQDCPDPETVFEAAMGGLGRDQTDALIDHLTQCVECSQAWQLASALAEENTQVTRISATWTQPLAIAAMVTFVAIGATFLAMLPQDQTPVYRDAPQSATVTLSETGSLKRRAFLLIWSGDEQATGYTLRVSDEKLARLFVTRDLKVTEYLVPEASLDNLPSGAVVYWQIEMQLPNGQIVQSATARVTLR